MNETQNAAHQLERFNIEEAEQSAEAMAQAFEQASERIAGALQRAASSGEVSFSQMAESISRDMARIAVQELIADPLESVFQSLLSSVAGQSSTAKTAPLNLTLNLFGQAAGAGTTKSDTQIAANIARALSRGRKLT